jgi:hypothetical protein
MKSIPGKFALLTGACGAALLVACGGGGADSAHGTLGVYLTDAPACGYDNVYVTVDNVRVHRSESAEDGDSGWIDIPVELADPKVDLLELTNGVLAKLGDVSLPAGTYNQVRLVLKGDAGANSVVPTGGSETALVTPSGLQSGLKLNGNFTIEEGATTELALDFDACKSVVKRGNSGSYGLKPVITMVVMSSGGGATSGAISGAVDAAVLSANPVVSAQVGGAIIKSTVPNADGTFSLSPLAEGTYTVVVTSDAHASDVIAGVGLQHAQRHRVARHIRSRRFGQADLRGRYGSHDQVPEYRRCDRRLLDEPAGCRAALRPVRDRHFADCADRG